MPNCDGTGPRGKGPRTGWGLGRCPPGASGNQGQTDRGFGLQHRNRFRGGRRRED